MFGAAASVRICSKMDSLIGTYGVCFDYLHIVNGVHGVLPFVGCFYLMLVLDQFFPSSPYLLGAVLRPRTIKIGNDDGII